MAMANGSDTENNQENKFKLFILLQKGYQEVSLG
jgi:hypothetical protein